MEYELKDIGTHLAKPRLGEAVPVVIRVSASVRYSLSCSLDRFQGLMSTSFAGIQGVATFDHLKALLCFDSLATESANRHACVTNVGCLCGESNICFLKIKLEL